MQETTQATTKREEINPEATKLKINPRGVCRGAAVFVITICIMTALLVAVAMIPKSAIRSNLIESADFLCERTQFGEVFIGKKSSMISRYADSVLLSIAWNYDDAHPLTSVMWSSFYREEGSYSNDSLRDSVVNDIPANTQYLRYWHGSIALIRPLLLWLSLGGIYVLHAVMMALLTVILLYLMIRRRAVAAACGLLAGIVITSAWFVPLVLEFTWSFYLMLVFSIIAWESAAGRNQNPVGKKKSSYGVMFLVFGMVTAYVDFLTTETVTLTVPLLLVLYHEKGDELKLAVKTAVSWLLGYAGAWAMKWLIASIVLKESAMPYVTKHIAERIGGADNTPDNIFVYIYEAIVKNVKLLLPFDLGTAGVFAGIGLILGYLYIAFVYRDKSYDRQRVKVFILIALVPYARYVVLHNHSYLHNHFTYRAQLSTVLAMILILNELKVFDTIRRVKSNVRR